MEQMLYERIQIMFRILSAFRRLNSFQIIVLGFAFVILLGAGILMLPVSSADGSWTPFVNALFTSVTSVCVTGLVVCDTGTYWSSFGHAVILLLIQTGGLGVVTISASFTILSGKKIGLSQRSIMAESVAAPQRSCPPDRFYCKSHSRDRTDRCSPDGTCILPRFWSLPGTLDVFIPLRIRILQRRNRSAWCPGSIFLPDILRI